MSFPVYPEALELPMLRVIPVPPASVSGARQIKVKVVAMDDHFETLHRSFRTIADGLNDQSRRVTAGGAGVVGIADYKH